MSKQYRIIKVSFDGMVMSGPVSLPEALRMMADFMECANVVAVTGLTQVTIRDGGANTHIYIQRD